MNKDEFKKIIGESIESKLREILPSVLDEYFSGMNRPSESPPQANAQNGNVRRQMTEVTRESTSKAPLQKRQYVKNPVLNDILNETTVRIKQEGQMVSAESPGGTPSVLDNIENVPKSVADVLTRDYSKLLKLSKTKSPNG